MNRFDSLHRLDLKARPADFVVLCAFGSLALLAGFSANPTLASALLPLAVAQVMVSWCRLAEPRWRALRFEASRGWQALGRDGCWQNVAVTGNFWSGAVVLVTISRRRARQHQALWRHHQPDGFRGLLGSIRESRDA